MSNLNSLKKSQLIDLVAQLERNAEDDRRRIGVMMYEANVMTQRIVELEAEVSKLEDSVESYQDRCDTLEAMIAKPSAPVQAPKRPSPKSMPISAEFQSEPVIEVSDFDKAMYRKFKALDRSVRLAIIEFARPQFGHVGVHNIIEVRAAWHEFNNPSSCADESVLADIA